MIDSETKTCLEYWLNAKNVDTNLVRSGRNNRSFIVRAGSERFFGKLYYAGEGNERKGLNQRQNAEWNFLKIAEQLAPGRTPKALFQDHELGLTLFEFIDGQRFSNPIGKSEALDAFAFLNLINKEKEGLPIAVRDASDSCFSLRNHVDHVEKRLAFYEEPLEQSGVPDQLLRFVREEIRPVVDRAKERLVACCSTMGVDMDAELPQSDRIVSPSDFGFHNALRRRNGSIAYLDFEYSGWDDPMKLVCDFFTQPDYPICSSLLLRCIGGTPCGKPQEIAFQLVKELLPLYASKWTCIIMNPLRACERERRLFAGHMETEEALLDSAIRYFRKNRTRVFEELTPN